MVELRLVSFSGGDCGPEWLGAASVRWDVFVVEQRVPLVLEVDARDRWPGTIHLVGFDGDRALGTCRLLRDGEKKFHLGRVAVRQEARGTGLGQRLVVAAESAAAGEVPLGDAGAIFLDSQVHAIGFYERCGYLATTRPQFYDAGILHQEMMREIEGTALLH